MVNHIENIVHVEVSKIHFIILRVNQRLEGFRKATAIQPNRSCLIRIRCSAAQSRKPEPQGRFLQKYLLMNTQRARASTPAAMLTGIGAAVSCKSVKM